MTNKEKYKETFRVLQPDAEQWEVQPMKHNIRTFKSKRVLALVAVIAVLLVASVGAYAADIGGIQGTVRGWLHGAQRDVAVTGRDDGGYDFEYIDENGKKQSFSGGGIAMEKGGKERPLTAEETLEGGGFEVVRGDDGRLRLYYYDKTYDITDLMGDDGVGKFRFKESDKPFARTLYVTVEQDVVDGELTTGSVSLGSRPTGSRASYIWLDK